MNITFNTYFRTVCLLTLTFLLMMPLFAMNQTPADSDLEFVEAQCMKIINELDRFKESKNPRILGKNITAIDVLYRNAKARRVKPIEAYHMISDLYIRVLHFINLEIDNEFDFNDPAAINVSPPWGPYPSGISPDSIKEPQLRKEYERLIAKNREKGKKYNFQSKLKMHNERLLNKMELFFAEAYSKSPESVKELKKYLKTNNVDKTTSKRMVKAAKNRLDELEKKH